MTTLRWGQIKPPQPPGVSKGSQIKPPTLTNRWGRIEPPYRGQLRLSRPAPQLTADLEDIEFAADQTYGWIIIRNTSATDCQLVGRIGLVGLDSTGTPDTVSVSAPVAGGLLLTADAAPVPNNKMPAAGEHVAFLVPGSSLSTTIGPNPGADCAATDQVTPSTFRLDISGSGTIMVPNTADGSPEQFRQLRVCQGQITAGTVTGEPN
jgi:hypothetical protein